MRLRVKQARQMDLNDAIRHAVEIDAFNSAERRLNESKGNLREVKPQEKAETGDTITTLLKAVQDIQKEMKDLKMKNEKGKANKPFYSGELSFLQEERTCEEELPKVSDNDERQRTK